MFMDVTAASDTFLVLLAAVIALPFLLAACWRHPAGVTLGFVAILCLFSSSTWGQLQEENTKLKNSKPIINAMSTPIEDVQVIYKYINNPSNIITNKSQKRLSNTAFDKFITNNKLIY